MYTDIPEFHLILPTKYFLNGKNVVRDIGRST